MPSRQKSGIIIENNKSEIGIIKFCGNKGREIGDNKKSIWSHLITLLLLPNNSRESPQIAAFPWFSIKKDFEHIVFTSFSLRTLILRSPKQNR